MGASLRSFSQGVEKQEAIGLKVGAGLLSPWKSERTSAGRTALWCEGVRDAIALSRWERMKFSTSGAAISPVLVDLPSEVARGNGVAMSAAGIKPRKE